MTGDPDGPAAGTTRGGPNSADAKKIGAPPPPPPPPGPGVPPPEVAALISDDRVITGDSDGPGREGTAGGGLISPDGKKIVLCD
ncbi:MAG: hypothetical protein LQ337_008470 [Flavoplaca oasis]|nr:MAG: hypothetical protein LQ337_008470 [Flavoplaca oasis]